MRKIKKRAILLLILLAAVAGIAGFWNWQRNNYSKEILKLEILGPETTDFAKDFEYTVKYKNNGNVRLEEARLIFEYPTHSITEDGKPLLQEISLEDIYPGDEKTISFKAKLIGSEEELFTAKASLSYRPKDLKARYERNTTFTTQIKSIPLTFEFVDLPSKIEPEKDFTFGINYFSNLNYPLTDLRIRVEYPNGFEFVKAIPKALEKVEWAIPVLNKLQGGRIEITGRLSGNVGEVKNFKASLNLYQEGEIIKLKETGETEGVVEIIKPSIYLRQEINKNPQYAALPGDLLHYEIYFKNIGEEDLNNLSLTNKLEGDAFDFQTIKCDLGVCQPGDNLVFFDWKKNPKLQYLAPMEEGKIDFWIKLKDDLGNVKNPTLKNKVFISQLEQEFETRIGSKLEIVQKGYFQDEVFGNSGIPPTVGQNTTYTIIWEVKNYYSDVKNVKVKATLPNEVALTGKIFPEDAASKFAFDSQSREIVWSVGDLARGSGLEGNSLSIAFQVAFVPSESQRGQTPDIIREAEISGEDSWTETILETTSPAINTTLPDDPTVEGEMGRVQ